MKPLSALTREEAARIQGLVSDVDDTILDHGALGEQALGALWRAHREGFPVLLATGRSIAFAEVLARMWPVVGAIAENGALACRRAGHGIVRWDPADGATRTSSRRRLERIADEVQTAFSEATLSDDAAGRLTDITFDIGETRTVPAAQVRAMATLAESRGARTTTSSVHLHLTLDQEDKASGTLAFLHRELGIDPTYARGRWAYVGDSVNDAPAFAAFIPSFGVANVRRAVPFLSLPPRFVAPSERGAGFAEIVDALLAARS